MEDTLRVFVAIKPPQEILRQIEKLQTQLKATGLALRWVRPANSHLTLKFLGDVPAADIAAVVRAMQAAARGQGPLTFTQQDMGVFPSLKRPRVLWTGLGGDLDRLQRLVQALEAVFEPLGFKREKRPFKAHLTLARIKVKLDSQQLLDAIKPLSRYEPLTFDTTKIVLYQSQLRPQGAVYTSIAHADLV